jgi:PhzF family phenazine biosynthesis protein
MQQVAMEMSVSESAFALPLPTGGEADWGLRWFTALVEDEMCGHATLATAHALHQDRGTAAAVRFQTRSGVLTARTDTNGNVTLDFPRAELAPVPVPAGLAEALGAAPDRTYGTGELGDVLAVFSDEAAVRGLRPDFAALAERQRGTGRLDRGVIATAAATAGSDYDFVSRFFTPAAGVPEDPATGSAHTALAPYWADQLGQDRLIGLQVSARTGRIGTCVQGDRVELTGRGVTVSDGRFLH